MRLMATTFGLFVLFALPSASAQDLPPLRPDSMALIERVRALAPEFSADNLLRLAGSSVVAEPNWKRKLIEEAFTSGAGAQLPYKKGGEESTDARASRANWKSGLDALTLQTRAVEAMLALDPQRARAMLEEIPTPQVPPLTCQETGAPDLSIYYLTAAHIFDRGFSREERQKLEQVQFLDRIIDSMQSPAHVTPAVKLIFTVAVTPEQRQELVTKLAGALLRIDGTARVFGAVTFQLVPVSAPIKLPPGVNGVPPLLEAPTGQLPPQVVSAAPILLPALRVYIVRHESRQQCSESIRAGELPSVIKDFNYLISKLDPNAYLYKPITQDEVKTVRDAGTYVRHMWWKSDRSKQVLSALQWLNHGNRNLPDDKRFFTPEERATEEWNTHFNDTLKLIEGWREGEEDSAEDWFGMVSEAYELLAEKAAPGKQREAAMSRYMTFMETHYTSIEHNLWFTQLHDQWRSKDLWMVEQFTSSANPVMALYAAVNKKIAQ